MNKKEDNKEKICCSRKASLWFLAGILGCAVVSCATSDFAGNEESNYAGKIHGTDTVSVPDALKLAPDVKEEMLSADWWISRCRNPDDVEMNLQEISLWNQKNYDATMEGNDGFYLLEDLRLSPDYMTADQIRQYMVYYNPSVPWYKKVETKKGTVIRTLGVSEFKTFWQEMNLEQLVSWKEWINQKWIPLKPNKKLFPVKRGICVKRSNLRLIPEDNFYSDDENYWYDDIAQNSGIHMNEPVLILWESLDKKWYYVRTGWCWGWIHKEDIALCTRAQFEKYFDWTDRSQQEFVTITADKFTLSEDYSIKVSGFKKRPINLYMGNNLLLADLNNKTVEEGFGGRIPYASYIVEVPYKKDDGFAGVKYAAIPAGICCRGLLPFTKRNVLTLAFKPLGQRYGWGGMADSRDCSEYLKDIYKCFGFIFARNSRSQLSGPGKTVDFENLSEQAKNSELNSLDGPVVMGFPGHVFLYLGKYDGKHYTISALGSYHPDGKNFDVQTDANSVNINTLDAARKNGKTWFDIVTKAKLLADDGSFENRRIVLNPKWDFASMSKINSGEAVLFRAKSNRKDIVIAVNAGHGTYGGSSVKTYSHPDKSPKVTGGTTAAGEIESIAVSTGMTFKDGSKEADVNLTVARFVKDKLIKEGYDVLMLRNENDVQLDNVARTVIASNCAQIHIAIHFDGDSEKTDKGCFYCGIPDELKKLKNVKKHAAQSEKLGKCFVAALKETGLPVYKNGKMNVDLTQTSYSTIPTMDFELGNQCTATGMDSLEQRADAVVLAVKKFFM